MHALVKNTVVLKSPLLRYIVLSIIFAGIIGIGIMNILYSKRFNQEDYYIFYAVVAAFLWCVYKIFTRKIVLAFDQDGIWFEKSRELIDWEDIREVRLEERTRRRGSINYTVLVIRFNGERQSSVIPFEDMAISPEELMKKLNMKKRPN